MYDTILTAIHPTVRSRGTHRKSNPVGKRANSRREHLRCCLEVNNVYREVPSSSQLLDFALNNNRRRPRVDSGRRVARRDPRLGSETMGASFGEKQEITRVFTSHGRVEFNCDDFPTDDNMAQSVVHEFFQSYTTACCVYLHVLMFLFKVLCYIQIIYQQ